MRSKAIFMILVFQALGVMSLLTTLVLTRQGEQAPIENRGSEEGAAIEPEPPEPEEILKREMKNRVQLVERRIQAVRREGVSELDRLQRQLMAELARSKDILQTYGIVAQIRPDRPVRFVQLVDKERPAWLGEIMRDMETTARHLDGIETRRYAAEASLQRVELQLRKVKQVSALRDFSSLEVHLNRMEEELVSMQRLVEELWKETSQFGK